MPLFRQSLHGKQRCRLVVWSRVAMCAVVALLLLLLYSIQLPVSPGLKVHLTHNAYHAGHKSEKESSSTGSEGSNSIGVKSSTHQQATAMYHAGGTTSGIRMEASASTAAETAAADAAAAAPPATAVLGGEQLHALHTGGATPLGADSPCGPLSVGLVQSAARNNTVMLLGASAWMPVRKWCCGRVFTACFEHATMWM